MWLCAWSYIPDPDDRPLWPAVLRFSFDFLQISFISNLPACQLASLLSVPHRTTWTERSQSLAGLSLVVLRGVFVEMVYLGYISDKLLIAPRFRGSYQVIYTIITKTVQSRSLSVASFDLILFKR
jgi:hypothetical protein